MNEGVLNLVSLKNVTAFIPLVSFLLLFVLQYIRPQRDFKKSGVNRIVQNLLLFLVNGLIMRMMVPISLFSIALWANNNQIGLFNQWHINPLVTLIICVVLMDMMIYWQHVASHKVNLFWRFHRVHHSDHDMDVSTAIRFHPIELVLSLFYKSIIVVVIGVPMMAVMIFELLLFISPAFNHSNIKLPNNLDAKLRFILVTPDMHRIHHSTNKNEQNSNYGFFLNCWDKLFSSYIEQPKAEHQDMPIGVSDLNFKSERVDQMLSLPFK